MAITLVHSASNNASFGPTGGTLTVTVTAPTSGNVVVFSFFAPASATVGTPALTNVTWTSITTQASGDIYKCYLYYGVVSGTGGTSLTVAVSAWTSGDAAIGQYAEFSGVATTSPVDVFSSNAATSSSGLTSATTTSPSITTTNAGDVVIAFLTGELSGSNCTASGSPANSFTSINTVASGGPRAIGTQLCYQVETATGSYSTAQTFTSSSSATYYETAIIVALLPGSGGGGGGGGTRRRSFIYID